MSCGNNNASSTLPEPVVKKVWEGESEGKTMLPIYTKRAEMRKYYNLFNVSKGGI